MVGHQLLLLKNLFCFPFVLCCFLSCSQGGGQDAEAAGQHVLIRTAFKYDLNFIERSDQRI